MYQYERMIRRIEDDKRREEEEKRKQDNRSGWDKFWGGAGDFAKGTAEFIGDTLQGIPRGVVELGLSAKQAMRDSQIDQANKNIDRVLGIDKDRREQLLSEYKDPEKAKKMSNKDWADALMIKRAQDKYGTLDDDELRKRKEEGEEEKKEHLTYKADNDFLKFILGGEDDEVAKSSQGYKEDIEKWAEERGMSKQQAALLGGSGAAALTVLNLPSGAGSLVKEPLKKVGKQGVKQLVSETSEEGVKSILKTAMPKATDEAIDRIVPSLASATDAKTVRSILRTADNLTETATGAIASAKGKAKQAVINTLTPGGRRAVETAADVAPVADDVIGAATDSAAPNTLKKAAGYGSRYAGDEGMDAVDELLGRVKSSSQLDKEKKGKWQSFKEQFVDKLSPVNEMVSEIEKRTGSKLVTEDNPYELMRLYQGMPDQVQQRVSQLTNILKESPDLDAVKTIGLARQIRARAGRGIDSFVSSDTADRAVQQWYDRLGQEGFDKAQAVVEAVHKYNQGLLDDLHRAGIVSDDALRAIKDSGADYFAKFNVIDYIMKSDQNRALFSKSGSYNATKSTLDKILKGAKGMAEGTEILDPIESIVKSTDATMRAIAKNEIWHAFDRLADVAPDIVKRVRDPENVAQRIAISLENKELVPVRNKLDSLIKRGGQQMRRLESEINKLSKQGLNVSLKKGGERASPGDFLVDGLGGKVPTSQVGKVGATTKRVGDETVRGFMDVVNPQKLGPSDTGRFVRNLIEQGSQKEIDKYTKMIASRDAKLAPLMKEIADLKVEYDNIADTIKGNRGKIKELADKATPEGMELISGFGKGVSGKLAIPKEIADVYLGKNRAQQDYLTSMMSSVNAFVKQNFTSNNIAFALFTNPARDFKSFAMNSRNAKAGPLSIFKAYSKGLFGRIFKDADYEDMIRHGGKSGFYSDERTAERLARDISRAVSGKSVLGVKVAEVHNAKDFVREATRVLTAPLRVVRDGLHGAASVLEDAPRLAEYKAALAKGKTGRQAAFDARNVTVDFQQSGRIGQTINAWIPFLNARAQGTLKTAEAIKHNPGRAVAVYATLTAAPIWATMANNMRFPDVMNNISDGERDNNFIIVLGDAKDEKGNYTQVIKIPKSDVDKIFGNPMEQLARHVYNNDPDTFEETLTNLIGSILPIDTVRDDKFSLETTVSSLLPPLIKAPVEAATNRNLYFGSDIVPKHLQDLPASEQVKDSTSPVAKFVASLTGGSPLKTENTLRSFTGTLLTKAPHDQLHGKIVGASANKMSDEFYSILERTKKNRASASKYINDAIARGDFAGAQQAAATYNSYLVESFTPFADRFGSQMTDELADVYKEQKIVLTNRSIKQRQKNALKRQAKGE